MTSIFHYVPLWALRPSLPSLHTPTHIKALLPLIDEFSHFFPYHYCQECSRSPHHLLLGFLEPFPYSAPHFDISVPPATEDFL